MEDNAFAKNPFLEQEDFFAGYKKNIDNLKNNPMIIEFDKLCYELFAMNDMGKRWMELIKERYIIPSLAKAGTATYQIDVIWGEGFKDFGRMIIMALAAHEQRIIAGTV